MSPKRIAIYHDLPSGGAKRTLFETVKRLSGRHTIDVFSLSTADEEFCDLRPLVNAYTSIPYSPLKQFQRPVRRLNWLQRLRDLWRLDNLSQQIAAKIDAGGYDIVFVQPCMWTQAPLILRFIQTPSIYYCHEPPRHLYESTTLVMNGGSAWRDFLNKVDPMINLYQDTARKLDWKATRKAHLVLVNSKYMQDTIRKIYGITPKISYHGIDTDRFYPDRQIKDGGFVLSVGSIQPSKGFDFIIQSLAQIPEQIRPGLWIIGNSETPEMRQILNNLAGKLGVKLMVEVGVSEETLVQRYNQATIFVYAPNLEPFGLAPLEAMACGTPVVGVAEGGVLETLSNGHRGILVERNPVLFAQAIRSLLDDPEKRRTNGQLAREYVVAHWSWENATEQIEEYINLVTG